MTQPVPNGPSPGFDDIEVVRDERQEILRRRRVAFPRGNEAHQPWTEANVGDDLVGLALSGGGIRSAMFNLGLLQAFHHFGLLRYFDYLSTVSGGSYIGAHLSSQVRQLQKWGKPADSSQLPLREEFPLGVGRHGTQPKRVLTFLRKGRYLDRPWELAAAYLWGWARNLAVFTSGLVFLCALLAVFWRLADAPAVRDALTFHEANPRGWLHWWTSDVVRAFLPSLLFLAVYGGVALLARRATTAENRFRLRGELGPSRMWAALVGVSFLGVVLGGVGCGWGWAVVLPALFLAVWGVNHWATWAPTEESQGLRARGLRRALRWSRLWFWLSLLISVVVLLGNGDTCLGPLASVVSDKWLIYNPDFGGDCNLDIEFLPRYVKWTVFGVGLGLAALIVGLTLLGLLLPGRLLASGEPPQGPPQHGQRQRSPYELIVFRAALTAMMLGVPLLVLFALARENVSGRAAPGKLIAVELKGPVAARLRRLSQEHRLEVTGVRLEVEPDPEDTAGLVENLGHRATSPPTYAIALVFNRDLPWDWYLYEPGDGVSYSLIAPWEDNRPEAQHVKPLSLRPAVYIRKPEENRYTLLLRSAQSGGLPESLDTFWLNIAVDKIQFKDPGAQAEWDAARKEEQEEAARKKRREAHARGGPRAPGRPEDEREPPDGPLVIGVGAANRPNVARLAPVAAQEDVSVLRGALNRWFKVDDQSTLTRHDQVARLQVLIYAGLAFLFTGLLVNFNRTSLHDFYQQRLADAYIEPDPDSGLQVRLSELDNVALGAPYHLMSATLNLLGYRRQPEKTWPFLFSSRYCGSQPTKYHPTRRCLGRFDDLATVTAISGAAVSPAQGDSLAVTFLMMITNLRLGQWLPHPQNWGRLGWLLGWPNALCLMLEALLDAEDRRTCFLSDGGHSENLGLWPLLQRRCKLVIVSDAGEDSRHTLEDFLKLSRRIRLHEGVQFLDLIDDRPLSLEAIRLQADFTSRYHFFVGRVRYPEGFMGGPAAEGYLIYLKPSLTLDEDNDLLRHFNDYRPFPHDPTMQQLFDQDKVESYRQLGFHIGEVLCRALPQERVWGRDVRLAVVDELFRRYLLTSWREREPDELRAAEALQQSEQAEYRRAAAAQAGRLLERARPSAN